jgi:hypothetical protein
MVDWPQQEDPASSPQQLDDWSSDAELSLPAANPLYRARTCCRNVSSETVLAFDALMER